MHDTGCNKNRNVGRKERNEEIARNLRRCQEEINYQNGNTSTPTPSVLNRPRNLSSREVFEDLLSIGIVRNPKRTVGGIAFDIGSTGLPRRPPRRLAKIEKTSMYTAEEKALMAELLRDGEVKEKALKRDIRQDKAKRKRMLKEATKKLKIEKKRKDFDERMKKQSNCRYNIFRFA
ncbi:hypothetical protein FSP39_008561 [Pinctada imbricata]|uniref:Uncharacterized protein n=1 Tax=Pinctada imbricata TaxID=66713 RepID=A0AA88Y3C4_PINIB|nr:hypothetical protein FSP39_008561 [Pinctada imbricata]